MEIERGAPEVPLGPQPEVPAERGLDLELPEDDDSEMELVGAHEFVPVLDQSQVSQAGVGAEHARTSLDRSLFEREAFKADASLARSPADESVTEMPPLEPAPPAEDEFFRLPTAPPAPAPAPAAKDDLDLPDLDLPPEFTEPPPPRPPVPPAPPKKPPAPPAAAPSPVRPAPPVPPPIQPPKPAPAKAAPPPPAKTSPALEPPELSPPSLDLAEATEEESFPPPVLEPHAPPIPEFDLPPASMDYEFSPESRLPFEEPPPKPAFEGDLADRPDTPDFSALAEKELPQPELSEEEMFFNVEREREKPFEPDIATGEMERIPAAPEDSEKMAEARRRLSELEELGEDFLDAKAVKTRLQLIEDLKSDVNEREFQFDELLGLMMKKEMGELTSELFMKELKLLKRRAEETRKKKPK